MHSHSPRKTAIAWVRRRMWRLGFLVLCAFSCFSSLCFSSAPAAVPITAAATARTTTAVSVIHRVGLERNPLPPPPPNVQNTLPFLLRFTSIRLVMCRSGERNCYSFNGPHVFHPSFLKLFDSASSFAAILSSLFGFVIPFHVLELSRGRTCSFALDRILPSPRVRQ